MESPFDFVSHKRVIISQLNITSALLYDFAKIGDRSTTNLTQDTTNTSAKNQVTTDISKVCLLLLMWRVWVQFMYNPINHNFT